MSYQIHITQNCNLSCRYCSQGSKQPGQTMTREIALQTVEFMLAHNLQTSPGQSINLNITGGEPLLRFDLLKLIVDTVTEKSREHGLPAPYLEISTNATLLTEEHMEYLADKNYSLYIGFDGTGASHDINRVFTRDQAGSYRTVLANIRKYCLINPKAKAATTLNMVIAPGNVQFLFDNFITIYTLLDGKNISLNIAHEQDWDESTLKILEIQLMRIADFYTRVLAEINPAFYIKLLDDQLSRSLRNRIFAAGDCGAATHALAVGTNGSIYACGGFSFTGIPEEDITIGNIYDGIRPQLVEKFIRKATAFQWDECRECAFLKKCFNYCPVNNYQGSQCMGEVSYNHCEINKRLIMAADRIIDILYKNHYAIFKTKFYNEPAGKALAI